MNTIFTFLTAGAVLAGLMQVPTQAKNASANILSRPLPAEEQIAFVGTSGVISGENISKNLSLVDTFFGEEAGSSKTQATINESIKLVRTRDAYPASLAVIQKYSDLIKAKAHKYGVPEDVALGIGLLENGGSETAVSSAGALGVFQLMPGTARSLGLKVNKHIDERRIPQKNIEAGMKYLALNFDRFGDWGLSTWAYHAGEGNVSKAIRIHAKANHGINLKGLKDARSLKNYVRKYGITINDLLSDPAVKKMTRKLRDDSSGYPYKVIATASLFRQAEDGGMLSVR